MTSRQDEWWRDLYDDHLADMLLVREDPAEVELTVAFLEKVLDLGLHAKLFDQCCGVGSLAVPLAVKGYRVFGCDLASGYVERAHKDAACHGVKVDLEAADAFYYVPPETCDAAFNWWTSFGYAARDDDNIRMLQRAFDALKPGGRFALDFMNATGVVRSFRPEVIVRRHTPAGPTTLTRLSGLDPATMILHKSWRYDLPDGRRVEHESRVRLYTPADLARLLTAAGFRDIQFFGGTTCEPLHLDGLRCIAVAVKPKTLT